MSKFQIITIAIFLVCIVAGVIAFAMYKGNSTDNDLPPITIWGTFPAGAFNQYMSRVGNGLEYRVNVTYMEKKAENFSDEFVRALAVGQGPDAILITADMLLPESNKLVLIPYSALSQRDFMDSYIQEANVYLTPEGILAVPFSIDPLTMYWNRDMFNAAGLATYPKYWDEFTGTNVKPGIAQKLTVKDSNGNVRKSAIAMGDFANIVNAREILGSLFLQTGNPVTVRLENGSLESTISVRYALDPVAAVEFFSQFSDPSSINYSWNKAMPSDKTAFLSGTLATYFGFASELNDIRTKNSNLNFDAAALPQYRTGGQKAVYGKMYGFSIVRASANANTAFQIISLLTSPENVQYLSDMTYLPTVRNEIIAQGSNDPYMTIFNEAALVSRTWLDADPRESRRILGNLVQSEISGQKSVYEALRDAKDQYDVVLKKNGI